MAEEALEDERGQAEACRKRQAGREHEVERRHDRAQEERQQQEVDEERGDPDPDEVALDRLDGLPGEGGVSRQPYLCVVEACFLDERPAGGRAALRPSRSRGRRRGSWSRTSRKRAASASPARTRPGISRAAGVAGPIEAATPGSSSSERWRRTRPGRSSRSSTPSSSTTVGERIPGANPCAAASWARRGSESAGRPWIWVSPRFVSSRPRQANTSPTSATVAITNATGRAVAEVREAARASSGRSRGRGGTARRSTGRGSPSTPAPA